MNAKMIIGICLVVFIVAGLIVLRLKNRGCSIFIPTML